MADSRCTAGWSQSMSASEGRITVNDLLKDLRQRLGEHTDEEIGVIDDSQHELATAMRRTQASATA